MRQSRSIPIDTSLKILLLNIQLSAPDIVQERFLVQISPVLRMNRKSSVVGLSNTATSPAFMACL